MLIYLLALAFLWNTSAASLPQSYQFDFQDSAQKWAFYGTGEGQLQKNLGSLSPGSLEISCLLGQEGTWYQRLPLTPGQYQITLQ
ncbi:MAG: hypothetical protein WCG27_10600, partial [Pseudomonadota bacterium]